MSRRASRQPRHGRPRRGRVLFTILVTAGLVLAGSATALSSQWWGRPSRSPLSSLEAQRLDGNNNNRFHPDWGRAGTAYTRVAPARYADGHSAMVDGPNVRFISNRVFNDTSQNIFSEGRVTQWGFVWGQFLDHTFGLRNDAGTAANIAFDANDPLESFTNDLGTIPFVRSAAAPGTGVTNAREQINTISSYIDAGAVYSDSDTRLEWLRAGPLDGNLGNNRAELLLPNGLLPSKASRGDPAKAPTMAIDGRLLADPNQAFVAGDVRANENIALTATHTLFAREHNRIVSKLPRWLSEEQKFQIARRIVIAEQQYITYTEFLPAMGVRLASYRGYNPRVNASLSNEFATVGYRAHSQIHGELEVEAEADRYTAETLEALEEAGVEVETSADGEDVEFVIPLNVAFFNPSLVPALQLGPLLKGIGSESEYNNDEQIDNQLRSVLFQVPVADNPECLDGPELADCFNGVVDLGAVDVERGRDHGMPSYNDLRRAYGLSPKRSFRAITGEASEEFPAGYDINNPDQLEFTELSDVDGNPIELGSEEADTSATRGVRTTPLAARLKAIYGTVDKVDAFVGMVAERHVEGAEFGELQLAIWRKQFQDLRDGDRFFYLNDPGLSLIRRTLGIDYRHSLAEIIAANTDLRLSDLSENVFIVSEEPAGGEQPEANQSGDSDPAATPAPTPSVRRRRR